MALFPKLPFHSGETPVSWTSGLAALHSGGGLKRLLEDQRINIHALSTLNKAAIYRPAKAGTEQPDRLLNNALVPVPSHELARPPKRRRRSNKRGCT